MRHKGGPYRQCLSCRRVFRKEELLRFVQQTEEPAFFDERQCRPGRGYYLCPEQGCFLRAWKNKRVKALFQDESAMRHLLHSVSDTLLGSLERIDGLPMSVDTAFDERSGQGDFPSGAVILVREDMKAPVRQALFAAAKEQGAMIFLVPAEVIKGTECRVIMKNTPKISPILRNLRFYERLSSKGRAL